MPELIATIAILGILLAIAVIIFLALLERWRVNAAANQLAADFRLAHSSATNQLTDWRVVLVPGRGEQETGPDYYLVKLNGVYRNSYPKPSVVGAWPRTLPAHVWVMPQYTGVGTAIEDNKDATYYVSPDASISEDTRTLEFNTDGAMTGYGSPSGTVRVTIDENPQRLVRYVSTTSRIRILP